jgi:hypothetical protein
MFMLYAGIGVLLLLGIAYANYTLLRRLEELLHDKKRLSKEVDILRKRHSGRNGTTTTPGSYALCKEKIETHLAVTLNETDWRLLQEIVKNPNLSNKILAEQVVIGHEGVRSALKKLYRLFQIDDAVSNKKMALAVSVTSICKENII